MSGYNNVEEFVKMTIMHVAFIVNATMTKRLSNNVLQC